MKTIAQLEIESNAAAYAHDRATDRLVKTDAVMTALRVIVDALASGEFPALRSSNATAHLVVLQTERAQLIADIDRLETFKSEVARAINAAPEEAA